MQRKKKAEAQGFGRGCVTWAKWQIKVEVFSPQFLALKPVCETDAAFDVEGKKEQKIIFSSSMSLLAENKGTFKLTN